MPTKDVSAYGGKKTICIILTLFLAVILSGCDWNIFPKQDGNLNATPVITESQVNRTITLVDNNQAIAMKTGEIFMLKLGQEDVYKWNVDIGESKVISRQTDASEGNQGVFKATSPGVATLTAIGDPWCRQSVPVCGMPALMFSLNIVVE